MKVFRLYIIIIFCLFSFLPNLEAQESIRYTGVVIDASTQYALVDVNIKILGKKKKGTISDSRGFFELVIDESPTTLSFSYIGYTTKEVVLSAGASKELIVELQPIISSIPEITVSAKRVIDTVYNEPYSVVSYEFLENHILLLAYKNSFEKYSLIILNEFEEEVAILSLKDKSPTRLHKNCLGEVFLLTKVNAYQIVLKSDIIQLKNRIKIGDFEDLLEPCVLSTEKFLYFYKYYYQGQALRYYAFPKDNEGDKRSFPMIQHEHNIDLLIEETGNRFPRSGDVWDDLITDQLLELRNSSYQLVGMMKIFYPKLYAPLVGVDSLVCIFNHQESELQYFTAEGRLVKKIPIDYHKNKKWRKKVLYDSKSNKAYTSFDTRWGEEIAAINLEDGSLSKTIPIDRAHIEQLKAWNGYLYFLFRDTSASKRNRKLHKIRID